MKHTLSRRFFLGGALTALGIAAFPVMARANLINFNFLKSKGAYFPYILTDAQWLQKLGPDGVAILRNGENETAGTSPLLRERRKGTYHCRGCNVPLFSSVDKAMTNNYPTFRRSTDPKMLGLSTDFGIILPRTEVHCKNCGSHLGYKFLVDGEGAELWRFEINGTSLVFQPA